MDRRLMVTMRRWVPFLTCLCLAVAVPAAVRAETDWQLARDGAEALAAQVAELEALASPNVDEHVAAAGATAVCLLNERILDFKANGYRITESAIYHVNDVEESGVATRHFRVPGTSRIVAVEAWRLRDGQVTFATRQNVTIIKGDERRATEVIVAVPGVQDGDVVGWSVSRAGNGAHGGLSLLLAGEFPVKLMRLRLLSDARVAYRLVGRNLGPYPHEHQVLERQAGVETHTMAAFRDIPPWPQGPHAPPAWALAPQVDISLRGALDPDLKAWLFTASWSEAAVLIEDTFEDLMEVDDGITAKARELTARLGTPKEKLAALYGFVRRDIAALDDDETPDELRPARETLTERNASRFEAGVLLCALANAAGVPVRPVLARSADLGPLDDGFPSLQQFSDLLVEPLDAPGTYCAPGRPNCPFGVLPDDLRGAPAMTLATGLADQSDRVFREVFSSVENAAQIIGRYQGQVARMPWQTQFRLPGDPAKAQVSLRETVVGRADCDTLAIDVVAQGNARLADIADGADPLARLASHCRRLLPAATALDAAADTTGALKLSGHLLVALGRPEGDLWRLSGEGLHGAPFLDGWDVTDPGAFHISSSLLSARTWRLRLPAGWQAAEPIPELNIVNPRFKVRQRMGVLGAELLLVREIEYVRGTTPADQIAKLAADVQAVRDWELRPILLVRTAASGGN